MLQDFPTPLFNSHQDKRILHPSELLLADGPDEGLAVKSRLKNAICKSELLQPSESSQAQSCLFVIERYMHWYTFTLIYKVLQQVAFIVSRVMEGNCEREGGR